LLCRKYFGAFLSWIKANPGFMTHCGVGADAETYWAYYYEQLASVGRRAFDVDYSNYDGSVTAAQFDFFRNVTDAWYGMENRVVRHGLLHVLQFSYVIVGDNVMRTEQGNKSGNPMTDVFNSVTNVFVLLVSYLVGRYEAGLTPDLRDFDRDVRMITYGDDVIASADDSTLLYFNRLTVASVAAVMGMKVTPANKLAALTAHEPLENAIFLKAHFVPMGGIVAKRLPYETVYKQLQWIKKQNVSDLRIQNDIVRGACRDMAHYGPGSLRDFRQQLNDVGLQTDFDYSEFFLDVLFKQTTLIESERQREFQNFCSRKDG